MTRYLVMSLTSQGYKLFNEETKKTLIKPKPGKFKYKNIDILIGDYLLLDDKEKITSIKERKNFLTRPKISNVDYLCIVTSIKNNNYLFLLDKFLTIANSLNITSKIIFTKIDLVNKEEIEEINNRKKYYNMIGYDVFLIDNKLNNKDDFEKLKDIFNHNKVAFVGQSGVGKSTLINRLDNNFKRKVDVSNNAIDRGRHITTDVSLLKYNNGFVFDTPGFSSLEINDLTKKDIANFFPGYSKYLVECEYPDCKHLRQDEGCNIILNVNKGILSKESYNNYLKLLKEIGE